MDTPKQPTKPFPVAYLVVAALLVVINVANGVLNWNADRPGLAAGSAANIVLCIAAVALWIATYRRSAR